MPVTCQICSRSFKQITNSHLKRHGITLAQYQARFPDHPLVSAEVFTVLRSDRVREAKRAAQRRVTPEQRKLGGEKVAASWTPERRRSASERMTRYNRDQWKDSDYRERKRRALSEQGAQKWADPDYRERMRLARLEVWKDLDYRALISEIRKGTWKSQEYRDKVLQGIAAYWTAEKREMQGDQFRELWKDPEWRDQKIEGLKEMWRDLEFQESMQPHVGKWTAPERAVLRWLEESGLYRTGNPDRVGFVDHAWVCGQFNADFVDFYHKLIIHVDGLYWHHPKTGHPRVIKRDRFADAWCIDNGWQFIRLTDKQISGSPGACKKRIRKLTRGLV